PALVAGKIVMLDRYVYSTIAYQGARSGNPDAVAARAFDGVPEPDAVFLIDVPAEVGLGRIAESRGEGPNAFGNRENLRAARTAFLDMPGKYANVVLIDGTQSAETVHKAILKVLLDGVLVKRLCAKPWGCGDPFNCEFRLTGGCRWAKVRKFAGLL